MLILESRSHLDLGDLPNMLAAELGVMTVRLERAIRSLDGVARVHVNRWGDGSAHMHVWFLARPFGRLQLRGTFLSLWDEILPPIPEPQWRENVALVAAWLGDFGGRALAEPQRIDWKTPTTLAPTAREATGTGDAVEGEKAPSADHPAQPSSRATGGTGTADGRATDSRDGDSRATEASGAAHTVPGPRSHTGALEEIVDRPAPVPAPVSPST